MTTDSIGHSLVHFLTRCPEPFHVVAYASSRLQNHQFKRLCEGNKWSVDRGNRYFVTRNNSSICAFAVGHKYTPGNGFKLISGHTDSPCLKLKPVTNKQAEGFHQIGVQTYGGGIWHTWFDRDLAIAGRVIVKGGDGSELCEKLFRVDKPLLKVPNICIHLNRDHNEKFSPNSEKHVVPIIASVEKHSLLYPKNNEEDKARPTHSPVLIKLMSEKLSVSPQDIVDFELSLYDFNIPTVSGAYDEFVSAARLDNLLSCYLALESLIESVESGLDEEDKIRMICLYDNEEVGSLSNQGAQSRFTESALRRANVNEAESFEEAMANSFHMSFDCAHYVHPNYPEKHEDNMKPKINQGPILKYNYSQRYATTSRSAAVVRHLAAQSGVPLQEFAVRNDSPCGTTVGPIIAARLGLETVDLGIGVLSMHSIRETTGVQDVHYGLQLMKAFFQNPVPRINSD